MTLFYAKDGNLFVVELKDPTTGESHPLTDEETKELEVQVIERWRRSKPEP